MDNLLKEINFVANSKGVTASIRDKLQLLYREVRRLEARRYIVAAAISAGDITVSMKRPARHPDILRQMADAGFPTPIIGELGFLTSDGLFVGREKAREIADAAGQIIAGRIGPDGVPFQHRELFSEDLW